MTRTDRRDHRQLIDEAQQLGPALARLAETAQRDPAVFCQSVLRTEDTNEPVRLAPIHEEWHDILTEHDRVVLWSATELAKAVPLTTQIPTPWGWRRMGELKVGDPVFGRDGRVCRITRATDPQLNHDVYRLTFDDGTSVLADAEHRWLARRWARKWHVHTTREMLEAGLTRGQGINQRKTWAIPITEPVQYPARNLPIPPYVLGAWLGDGDSADAVLTFHESDRHVFDRCAALVGAGPTRSDPRNPSVLRATLGPGEKGSGRKGAGRRGDPACLRYKLNAIGVLGDKRIPQQYLIASVEDRRELLAGLLDTDGTASAQNPNASCIALTLCNEELAENAVELIRSLGFKPKIKESPATLYGRIVGTQWRITFTARVPVFTMPRKLARQNLTPTRTRAGVKYVVSIDKVDSVPVRCIAVDSPDHTYLMGRDYTVTHNTAELSVGRVLWEIGKNPNIRILILASAADPARKIVRALKSYIERSVEFRLVFPGIMPDKAELWTNQAFIVKRSSIGAKDPTVQACGFGGNVLGGRYDLIVVDDYLTAENTHTEEQREKYYGWLKSTIEGRKTTHCRIWFIGNAWHPDDAMHRYAAERRTFSKKFPVRDAAGNLAWSEMWPEERIEAEIENRGPIESRRSMFCDPVADADRRFKEAYVKRALINGDGVDLAYSLAAVPPGWRTVTGVDIAAAELKRHRKKRTDLSAIVTIAVREKDGVRSLLDVESGRWPGPELVERIIDANRRYNSQVIVESNASQIFIKQFVNEKSAVPTRAFYTGKNKYDPSFGIESLAIEFSAGKWVIPNRGGETKGIMADMHPEVRALIGEMLRYDPKSHTGDRLIGLWLAREGARFATSGSGYQKRRRRT